jgi:hypothetical protein
VREIDRRALEDPSLGEHPGQRQAAPLALENVLSEGRGTVLALQGPADPVLELQQISPHGGDVDVVSLAHLDLPVV